MSYEETVKIALENRPFPDRTGSEIVVNLEKSDNLDTDVFNDQFILSVDNPVQGIDEPALGLSLLASRRSDSRVGITMRIDSIKMVYTESIGSLTGAPLVDPYTPGDTDITLHVPVKNYGDLLTVYMLNVIDRDGLMDQAASQMVTLDSRETFTFNFGLHNPDGFGDELNLLVQLISPGTARLYGEAIIQ